MIELNKIYNMDCIEGMKQIGTRSIDLILTDPPYGIGKKGVTNDRDLSMYYRSLSECYRLLKDNRFFVTFTSIGRLPDFFKNNPFKYRWQFIVYFSNTGGHGGLGFNDYISVLVFQKGKATYKRPIRDLFVHPTSAELRNQRFHPTQKQVEDMEELIKCLSVKGDTVLDPFVGVGTTAVAAKKLGRNFIGFEIEPKYVEIANKRLKNTFCSIDVLKDCFNGGE